LVTMSILRMSYSSTALRFSRTRASGASATPSRLPSTDSLIMLALLSLAAHPSPSPRLSWCVIRNPQTLDYELTTSPCRRTVTRWPSLPSSLATSRLCRRNPAFFRSPPHSRTLLTFSPPELEFISWSIILCEGLESSNEHDVRPVQAGRWSMFERPVFYVHWSDHAQGEHQPRSAS
jgi:hypothetical protein